LPPLVLKSATLYSDRDGMGYKPSLDAHFPVDGRIVFTFNDIPEDAVASAAFDSGLYAPAVVDIVNNTVTVTPALLAPETEYKFTLRIVRSAAEPYTLYDSPKTPTAGAGAVGPLYINAANQIAFKTAPSELVLIGTNLYTDRSGFANTPNDTLGYFPVDRAIVFTFTDIPVGAVAKVTFTPEIYATVDIDAVADTVTIASAQFEPNTDYDFKLDIIKSTATPYIIYRTPGTTGGPLVIGADGISFKTAASELTLVSTNLYIDRDGIQQPPSSSDVEGEGIFAGSAITFTFDSLPPETEAMIVADLVEVPDVPVPVTISHAGNTVTITPVQLKLDRKYTLDLSIRSMGSQRFLYTLPDDNTNILKIDASNHIEFRTATLKPLAQLIKTNLYIDPATSVDMGAGIQPPVAAASPYFAPGEAIVLTYGEPIPGNAVINIQLKDARYNTIQTEYVVPVSAPSTLRITPEALKLNATYYLTVDMVDVTGVAYWKVPASSTVADVSQVFNTGATKNDEKWYIGFSTQNDPVARLVSTNLYLDGDPANYNEPYFRLTDTSGNINTIELNFAGLPSGTKISDVHLAASSGGANISAYARFDSINTNKVKITPNRKLALDGTYYLKFKLTKTVGAIDPVWEVKAATNNVNGVDGPVYIAFANNEIVFKTAATFRVANATTTSNVPVNSANATLTTVDATDDIIFEFNRPIKTVTTAQLRYHVGGEYYTPITNNVLSEDKTFLTIRPTNLLAPSATFVVRLDVISEDDQRIVYDSTNIGDPSAWANSYNGDLNIATSGNPYLTGSSKAMASAGTLTFPSNTNVPKTDSAIDLRFAPTRVDFVWTYQIYVRRFGLWNGTPLSDADPTKVFTVPLGSTTATTVNVSIPAVADGEHFDAEGIAYKVRGINSSGYVSEATTAATIDFAN
jgi:hypothetical protein